jgi:hypothetical protein
MSGISGSQGDKYEDVFTDVTPRGLLDTDDVFEVVTASITRVIFCNVGNFLPDYIT